MVRGWKWMDPENVEIVQSGFVVAGYALNQSSLLYERQQPPHLQL